MHSESFFLILSLFNLKFALPHMQAICFLLWPYYTYYSLLIVFGTNFSIHGNHVFDLEEVLCPKIGYVASVHEGWN
jgi:hypothetical protein